MLHGEQSISINRCNVFTSVDLLAPSRLLLPKCARLLANLGFCLIFLGSVMSTINRRLKRILLRNFPECMIYNVRGKNFCLSFSRSAAAMTTTVESEPVPIFI